jgi:hypothetical protein
MEMQEMIERHLAGQAKAEADRKAMQEKADADRTRQEQILKAMQEKADAGQAEIIAAIEKKTDALIKNIKNDQEETTACHDEMEARINKTEPNSGEEETAVNRNEIPNEEVTVQSQKTCRSKTAPSQEATETKPDPGKMQSVEEHQEIPKEDAAVMPFGGLRKRRRDRNLAAGRRRKPKRRIQAACDSRRRLIVAVKITSRATAAWHKRNVVRRIRTQENYGPRKTLTVTGRRTTSRAIAAWHSKNVVRKDCVRDQTKQETQKRRKEEEEGLWKGKECNSGTRNRGLRQQVRRRMRIRNL